MKRSSVIALFLFALAFISFQYNGLFAVNDFKFRDFDLYSDQFVLDGILRAKTGEPGFILGMYVRANFAGQGRLAHELFDEGNVAGEFWKYRSSFGLQGWLFGVLHTHFGLSIQQMYAVNALALALVVSALFAFLSKHFSFAASAGFALTLILSPWVVAFARNLFWVEWTWFLPLLAAIALGNRAVLVSRDRYLLAAALFGAFFLKSLCGYDYVTTIFIASLAPLLFFLTENQKDFKDSLQLLTLAGVAMIMGLVCALLLHAASFPGSFKEGVAQINITAHKRLSSDNPAAIIDSVCRDSVDKAVCAQSHSESLRSSRTKVVARYFAFRDFLPWLGNIEGELDKQFKADLKSIYNSGEVSRVKTLFQKYPLSNLMAIFTLALSTVVFLAFLLTLAWQTYRLKSEQFPLAVLVWTSFLAPLSWFILFKGHSYVHTYLNYVLWFIGFVPFGVLFLIQQRYAKSQHLPLTREKSGRSISATG